MELRIMLGHASRAVAGGLLQSLSLDGPALGEPFVARPTPVLASLDEAADFPGALAAWAMDRHLEPRRPPGLAGFTAVLDKLKAVAITNRWRDALVLSNEESDAMSAALLAMPRLARWGEMPVPQRKRLLARADWARMRALWGAVARGVESAAIDVGTLDTQAAELFAAGVAPDPLLTGDELIVAGMTPGPAFKGLLESVYDAQLDGRVTTRDQALELAKTLAGDPT
jgi:hypothetical protein